MQQENDHLWWQVVQLQQQIQTKETNMQRLRTENVKLDATLLDFRKEMEALMSDYQASADRVYEAEADGDKYKNQYETALRELAQRAERIKLLEQQRKEATEMNEHMGYQVGVCHPTSISQ